MKATIIFFFLNCIIGSNPKVGVDAWTSHPKSISKPQQQHEQYRHQHNFKLEASSNSDISSDDETTQQYDTTNSPIFSSRRQILKSLMVSVPSLSLLLQPILPANALVKGVAPPPRSKAGAGGGDSKPKCTNVEECQALAEKREAELRATAESGPPPMTTKSGVKYRDLEVGSGDIEVSVGDEVNLYFKILKLGKRSYDGLSGEGTVVFSRGYGLEDDEDKPGTKSFQTFVGNTANIAALNDALVGMKMDGIRRFAILPQKGWEKATAACDGGPGGSGAGGELKTVSFVLGLSVFRTLQMFPCKTNVIIAFSYFHRIMLLSQQLN
jgi:hypothetical protein